MNAQVDDEFGETPRLLNGELNEGTSYRRRDHINL